MDKRYTCTKQYLWNKVMIVISQNNYNTNIHWIIPLFSQLLNFLTKSVKNMNYMCSTMEINTKIPKKMTQRIQIEGNYFSVIKYTIVWKLDISNVEQWGQDSEFEQQPQMLPAIMSMELGALELVYNLQWFITWLPTRAVSRSGGLH